MKSEFENYYEKVQEDAKDMVNETIDELLVELKESYSYSYETFERLNERYLNEYNEHIVITLRDSVEILEQTVRQINDEALYENAGDCKDQIKALAYHTYKNDLMAEFRLALKVELENQLEEVEVKLNSKDDLLEDTQESLNNAEEYLQELREELEELNVNNNKYKILEDEIANNESVKEEIEKTIEVIEGEIEPLSQLRDNIEKMIGELANG